MGTLLREDKTDKPDFTYLGIMYGASERKVRRLMHGAVKYDRLNWRNCKDNLTYQQSAVRHLFQYLAGDKSEDHLAAAGVNIDILLDLEENHELPK